MLSIVATRHAAEKLELREQQKTEREELREKHQPLPQYKKWKEQPQIVSHSDQDQIEVRPVQQPQLAALLRSLRQSPDLSGYFTYRSGSVALFRDEGKIIAVLDQSSRSVAAALAVAQQKYGQTLTLTGDDAFKRCAVSAAVAHGLSVKFADPELEALRLQMTDDKRQAERAAQAVKDAAMDKAKEEEKAAAQAKAAALKESAPALDVALPAPDREADLADISSGLDKSTEHYEGLAKGADLEIKKNGDVVNVHEEREHLKSERLKEMERHDQESGIGM